MTDLSLTRLWLMRAGFVLLTLVIVFFHLLPLDTMPGRWAGPDLVLCFALAWSLRRPEYVPPVLLALVFLAVDLLLQRPPGLWAMFGLIGCENLKSRSRGLRDGNFASEWITVGLIMIAVTFGYRLVLALAMVDLPRLPLSLTELGMTVLAYPGAVAVSHFLMGVRKAAPGDLDALGQRG